MPAANSIQPYEGPDASTPPPTHVWWVTLCGGLRNRIVSESQRRVLASLVEHPVDQRDGDRALSDR
jgi:hypothetical protein